jgi:replicative DNA helicase
LQLGKDAILTRYLSANSIGMSRGVIDVASVCLLIRKMHIDEYEGGKNEIEIIKPFEGTSSGIQVKADKDKRHSIIFIAKNRNGAAEEEQIVAKHELGSLRYEELGVTNIPFGT